MGACSAELPRLETVCRAGRIDGRVRRVSGFVGSSHECVASSPLSREEEPALHSQNNLRCTPGPPRPSGPCRLGIDDKDSLSPSRGFTGPAEARALKAVLLKYTRQQFEQVFVRDLGRRH
jgi:hypothetical protein